MRSNLKKTPDHPKKGERKLIESARTQRCISAGNGRSTPSPNTTTTHRPGKEAKGKNERAKNVLKRERPPSAAAQGRQAGLAVGQDLGQRTWGARAKKGRKERGRPWTISRGKKPGCTQLDESKTTSCALRRGEDGGPRLQDGEKPGGRMGVLPTWRGKEAGEKKNDRDATFITDHGQSGARVNSLDNV